MYKVAIVAVAMFVTLVGIIVLNPVEGDAAAPTSQSTRHLLPFTDSLYDVGTSTKAYRRGFFDELCLTADTCESVWPAGGSGSGAPQTWELISNFLRPTSTAGIIVSASSTFQGGVTIDRSTTTRATTT